MSLVWLWLEWLLAGFIAGLLDYGFAVGFGLVASGMLVGAGFDPRSVAGAAAVAQVASALAAVVAHRRVGNVDWGCLRGRLRLLLLISLVASASALAASRAVLGLGGRSMLGLYAALLALLAGTATFYGRVAGVGVARAVLFSAAAGAYKAVVGGGYSVLVVLAAESLGLNPRLAIAVMPLLKIPPFLLVAASYTSAGWTRAWQAAALTLGALVSTLPAAKLARRYSKTAIRAAVAVAALAALLRLLEGAA
jgi:uncharacterized membrane protein YfcA